MAAPRKYPDELRERAVRLYRESDPKPTVRRLAEQLNVHPEALRTWIRQAEADRGQRHDRPTTDVIEENRRLKRENAELKRVNDVLRSEQGADCSTSRCRSPDSKYMEAADVATQAKDKLIHSQSTFSKFAAGYAEKSPFNIADISTGLAGAIAERTSKFRAAARAMDPGIERAARYARSGRINLFAQARADALEIERRLAKQAELNKALASRTARMVDKLPTGVTNALQRTLSFGLNADDFTNPLLRGSIKLGGKLPVVGGVISAAGVGYDLVEGKDPATSIASGAGSFVAGSLATAAIASAGGPVGWAVAGGALVSAGVGFAIEEWGDDMAGAAGEAAEWTGDRIEDAGDWAGDRVSDVGDAVSGLGEKIF